MAALDQYIVTHNHSVLVHTVHTHSTSINNFFGLLPAEVRTMVLSAFAVCRVIDFAPAIRLAFFGLEAVATTTHARALPVMDLTRHLSNVICNCYVLVVAGTVASIPFAI